MSIVTSTSAPGAAPPVAVESWRSANPRVLVVGAGVDLAGIWMMKAGISVPARTVAKVPETFNGYPVLRIEDMTPDNWPYEPEADDGDYFRAQ